MGEAKKRKLEMSIVVIILILAVLVTSLLTEKIARNELGDIVQLKMPLGYAKSDTLGEISEDVANQVSSVYTYIGKTYGVGAVQATSGILYNKQLFAKYHLSEPKTWNDFLRICRTLRANGVTPIGVGGSDLWHMEYWVNHFFRVDVLSGNENWLQDCAVGRASWDGFMLRIIMKRFVRGHIRFH